MFCLIQLCCHLTCCVGTSERSIYAGMLNVLQSNSLTASAKLPLSVLLGIVFPREIFAVCYLQFSHLKGKRRSCEAKGRLAAFGSGRGRVENRSRLFQL